MTPLDRSLKETISTQFKSKILYSLLAILLTVAIVPLLLYGWKSIEINRETLQTNLQEFQLNIARSISNEVILYLDALQNQIGVLAKAIEIGSAGSDFKTSFDDLRKGQGGLVKVVSEGGNFYSVRVYDIKGNWTQAGISIEDENITADMEDAFLVAVDGTSYVSPRPEISQTLQEPVLVMAQPIYSKGAVAGVVASITSFEPILRSLTEKSREGSTVYLVDKEGTIFAHPDRAKLLAKSSIADTPIFKEMSSARGVASATVPFKEMTPNGEVDYVGTFDWVPRMNWGVVVQVEQRRVFYSVDQMRRTTILWGLIGMLAAVAAGIFFAKRISTPIQRVAKGATALAGRDFSHRIEVRSRNEIGQLAETFNFMSDEIHNYVEKLKWAAEENKQLFVGSIQMMAAAIDEKDPYTHGHSERVARYSKSIAVQLGLGQVDAEKVWISALLHDVGKIGIRDSVLGKPDTLTKDELDTMRQHPTKGATIMSPVRQLKDIIPGIKHHHESYDGSGYPDRLKGEDIPVMARIISVADTFDAMTTDRPYQRAMDPDYALDKIRSWIGKRFDGRVVDALGKALAAGQFKADQEAENTAEAGVMYSGGRG
ncbi:MAG: HD domain-containing phosphohydrolase [Acidobacteriota bacterium]